MKVFIRKNCVRTIGFLMRLDGDCGDVKKSFSAIRAEGRE
jgi:hypothetical protein